MKLKEKLKKRKNNKHFRMNMPVTEYLILLFKKMYLV
jgi:hypothetical protein